MNAAHFASVITRTLCTELGVQPEKLVCMSRDSVLVNGAACRLLQQGVFWCAENQLCIAHTLNNVGGRFDFQVLSEFFSPWLELVGGRHPHRGAQALWRTAVAPQKVPGYSATRWYAAAEIQFVLADNFQELEPLLKKLEEHSYGDATRKKLAAILRSEEKSHTLQLQLAAMKDLSTLVHTTYELEGDQLELLLVYQRIEQLRKFGRDVAAGAGAALPNVDLILRSKMKLTNGVKIEKVWNLI